MSLADHAGGNCLGEGEHLLQIKGFSFFSYNTGSRGVQFEIADRGGKGIKESFCLKESILWRLAAFADACGITKEEMGRIDPANEKGFQVFTGKKFRGIVAKGKENAEGKRYHELIDWMKAEAVAAPPASKQRSDEPPPIEPEDDTADIPF